MYIGLPTPLKLEQIYGLGRLWVLGGSELEKRWKGMDSISALTIPWAASPIECSGWMAESETAITTQLHGNIGLVCFCVIMLDADMGVAALLLFKGRFKHSAKLDGSCCFSLWRRGVTSVLFDAAIGIEKAFKELASIYLHFYRTKRSDWLRC